MGIAELITRLQEKDLTTGEILAILLFVAEYGIYNFTCCHRGAFKIHLCPVRGTYTVLT